MTALIAGVGIREVRWRIPFFWWSRQPRMAFESSTVQVGFVCLESENTYIPTGTADLWRSARRRPGR